MSIVPGPYQTGPEFIPRAWDRPLAPQRTSDASIFHQTHYDFIFVFLTFLISCPWPSCFMGLLLPASGEVDGERELIERKLMSSHVGVLGGLVIESGVVER